MKTTVHSQSKYLSLWLLAAGTQLLWGETSSPSITVYNKNFAVVRQEVPVKLSGKVSEINFSGVTAQVWPDSVVLRDPAGKALFRVLEQNYRNDPVSQSLLLKQFEGQSIDFEIKQGDNVLRKNGIVIRSGFVPGGRNTEPIIQLDGRIQFGLPGRPLFPKLGEGNILKPTLNWRLTGNSAEFPAQLSYLTGGFSWSASYNVVARDEEEAIDITGWITLKNQSGATFENASLKLMAGDVNVIRDHSIRRRAKIFADRPLSSSMIEAVTGKSFDSFHLYNIGFPVTTRNRETKQIELLRASNVKAHRKFVYDTRSRAGSKVGIFWEFRNDKKAGLGLPLPAGTIRVYRKDNVDNNLEFVGSDRVGHTPRNEKILIYTGNAFDLVVERKILKNEGRNNDWLRQTVEVELRNRSEKEATIEVVEHLSGWPSAKLEKASQEYREKIKNASHRTVTFKVILKPDEKKTISYTSYLNR